MKFRLAMAAAVAAASVAAPASAADLVSSASFSFTSDLLFLDFSLATNGSNVRMWTDSYQSGTNFDPVITLFVQQGADFVLVDQNDEIGDASLNSALTGPALPGQTQTVVPLTNATSGDALMIFPTLAAGNYRLALSVYDNFPIANAGGSLNLGWNITGSEALTTGGFGRVTVDNLPAPVPEPATWLLALTGLAGLAALRRRSA